MISLFSMLDTLPAVCSGVKQSGSVEVQCFRGTEFELIEFWPLDPGAVMLPPVITYQNSPCLILNKGKIPCMSCKILQEPTNFHVYGPLSTSLEQAALQAKFIQIFFIPLSARISSPGILKSLRSNKDRFKKCIVGMSDYSCIKNRKEIYTMKLGYTTCQKENIQRKDNSASKIQMLNSLGRQN